MKNVAVNPESVSVEKVPTRIFMSERDFNAIKNSNFVEQADVEKPGLIQRTATPPLK